MKIYLVTSRKPKTFISICDFSFQSQAIQYTRPILTLGESHKVVESCRWFHWIDVKYKVPVFLDHFLKFKRHFNIEVIWNSVYQGAVLPCMAVRKVFLQSNLLLRGGNTPEPGFLKAETGSF
jgi:hypothetical protein